MGANFARNAGRGASAMFRQCSTVKPANLDLPTYFNCLHVVVVTHLLEAIDKAAMLPNEPIGPDSKPLRLSLNKLSQTAKICCEVLTQ